MDENDGPLIPSAGRAAMRPFDSEREQRGHRGDAKGLLCDQVPCRPFGHPIVLDHRVSPPFRKDFCGSVHWIGRSAAPPALTANATAFEPPRQNGTNPDALEPAMTTAACWGALSRGRLDGLGGPPTIRTVAVSVEMHGVTHRPASGRTVAPERPADRDRRYRGYPQRKLQDSPGQ